MAFGAWLPYSGMAPALGFAHLPWLYWQILVSTLLAYLGLTQLIKSRLARIGRI
jgi:Mg2+-importing ATPase